MYYYKNIVLKVINTYINIHTWNMLKYSRTDILYTYTSSKNFTPNITPRITVELQTFVNVYYLYIPI